MSVRTITITFQDYEDFKLGFIKKRPVPLDAEGVATMTEDEWVDKSVKDYVFSIYQAGKSKIAQEASVPQVNEEIVTIA